MPDPLRNAPARVVGLLVAVVVAVVGIGLATGMSPQAYRAKRPPVRERADPGNVPPARSHAELEKRPWSGGPRASGWAESKQIAAESARLAPKEGASIDRALRERAARRAYDGAPPVIPHPVQARGAGECLACHAEGFVLGERRAGAIPHAAYASCTQCHVSANAPFAAVPASTAASVANGWVGLAAPVEGAIAYAGAPPAVPHSTRMRERCESCHGPGGEAALQTPHPERLSCLQCHPATGGRNAAVGR